MTTVEKDDIIDNYGIALIDRSLLGSLETLWTGPLDPSALHNIEITLRAFVTEQVLTLSRIDSPWDSHAELCQDDKRDWTSPFDDHLLDYEFVHPGKAHPVSTISHKEASFIDKLVTQQLGDQIRQIAPKWATYPGQVRAYYAAWYAGVDEATRKQFALRMGKQYAHLTDGDEPFSIEEFQEMLVSALTDHARYLVGSHRAGLSVYGNRPVHEACNNHVFSRWPQHIFEGFDNLYHDAVRMTRGPGISVDLPPLTAVVLSRAKDRHDIPIVLRDMREQYKDARKSIWRALEQMWQAPTLAKQISHMRDLSNAASSIFDAAFPQRFDILELGLGVAQFTPGGAAQAFRSLRERDRPNARVAAFSFTKRLAADIRSIENARKVLKRHLTTSELAQFGI